MSEPSDTAPHAEFDVDVDLDPLADGPPDPNRSPYDANQAIPTLLFGRKRRAFEAAFPDLTILEATRFAFAAYPASGGFRRWSLMPAAVARPLLKAEWALRGVFGPLGAFRTLVTVGKRAA